MIDELLKPYENQYGIFAMTPGDLREFAEKIAAAEREACANVCEDLIGTRAMARHCADAIRARGEK